MASSSSGQAGKKVSPHRACRACDRIPAFGPFPPRLHAHDHAFPTTAARCVLQVLTHTNVIAIPENSVAGFAGISFNGHERFQ